MKLKLYKLRKSMNLTQKQMGLKLGYNNHVMISRFENGSHNIPPPTRKAIEYLEILHQNNLIK